LLTGKDAHAGLSLEALLSPLSEPRPDAIISAQRVAAGENEASGFSKAH
jgi:hypothetical protein